MILLAKIFTWAWIALSASALIALILAPQMVRGTTVLTIWGITAGAVIGCASIEQRERNRKITDLGTFKPIGGK